MTCPRQKALYQRTASTRLQTLGSKLGNVAEQRRSEPKILGKIVHGDLDWIVMKALEKDRGRRYDSAVHFAQDIDRYLSDEPVLARSSGKIHRTVKYLRRYRVGIFFIGGGLAVATVLLLVVFGFYHQANMQRHIAMKQRMVAEDSHMRAMHQAARVEEEASLQREMVLRLSDQKRLGELISEAESLWPAHPRLVTRYERWLEDGREILGRLEDHREKLSQLRELGTPVTGEHRKFNFENPEDQWYHDLLADLVGALESFSHPETGVFLDVEKRRTLAKESK